MSDLYLEELVKRKWTTKDRAVRILLIALTVILILGAFFVQYILVFPAIAICIADIFIFPRFNIEWEYQYVNGELDVDRIINKAKRKRRESIDLDRVEIIAPAVSHRLDYYNNNRHLKEVNYTSNDPEREKQVYAMIVADENSLKKVLFEPTEKMLRDMRTRAPRKVYLD